MLGRLPALVAIAMMLACGGDPAPLEAKSPKSERKSDEARAERKRKRAEEKKRKEQEEADEAEREARRERMRKRDEEAAQDQQEPQETRVAEKDEPAADESEESSDEEAEKKTKAEEAREAKKAKAEAKKAAAAEAKAKKAAEAEAKKEKLAKAKKKKKKNVEEVEESDEAEEEVAVEEDKPNPFKKKESKKKDVEESKKVVEEPKKVAEEEPAEEEEEPAPKPEPKAKAKPKQVAKADKRKPKAKPEPEEKVDESEIEVDTASLPPPDPSEESNELDLNAGSPARDEEPVAVAPPTLAIDRRPLTLGRGKIEAHGGLVATAVTASNGMGGTTTASAQGLALGVNYGIGAAGELGIDYTLGLHPGDLQGPLMFHGAYVAKHSDKLDIAVSLGLAIDFVDSIDPGTMVATTRTAKALQVGVWARYHLGAKLSAFSGLPALPSSAGGLGGTAPLPPIPYQLSIGLSSLDAIALDIPAGLGYQATPKLYTFGVLDLAHLGMNNTASALIFSDFVPISLGGFYAASKMDIGAVFSDDLKQAADYLRFDVVVRYSIK